MSGDTINCLAGNYTWVSQAFLSSRNVVGAGYATTIFDGAAANVSWNSSATLAISGITFKNAVAASNSQPFQLQANGASISLTNCSITATTISGWGIFGTNNGITQPASFSLTGCLIVNCVNGAGGNDALFSDQAVVVCTLALTNNTIYTNQTNAATLPMYFFITWHVTYTNNIIYNANGVNKGWALASAVVETGSNNDILGFSSAPSLTAQISTDPLFVDATNANFNLRPTSPCIGAGTVI